MKMKKARRGTSKVEVTGKGVDDFAELGALKREAEAASQARGHRITTWHQRGSHDPYGREAFCDKCHAAVVVSTEPDMGRGRIYGWTLKRDCN